MRMPAEGFIPGVLDLSHGKRLEAYVTGEQFAIEGQALYREGVMQALGVIEADEQPWDAFASVMGGIAAQPDVAIDTPLYATTVNIPFYSVEQRVRFDNVNRAVLGGMHGYSMPLPNGHGNMLRIERYGYASLSSLARVGTITLRQQLEHEESMPDQNIRQVERAKIGELEDREVVGYLPGNLQDFIDQQHDLHGDLARDFVLSSGNLSLVGMAMREKLRETYGDDVPLAIQLPHGEKPTIEKRVKYRAAAALEADKDHAPTSVAGVSSALAHQGQEQLDELVVAWEHRDLPKMLKFMWEVGTGFGATEGGTAVLRAVSTIIAANSSALYHRRLDQRLKKQLGLSA